MDSNGWIDVKDGDHSCTKRRKHSDDFGVTGTSICGKPAVWKRGNAYYCQHHSLKGRFIIRDGDFGEIKARFDTEEELRAAIVNHPGMIMQHINKSHRRIIV